jgi:hypothetical protein
MLMVEECCPTNSASAGTYHPALPGRSTR